MTSLINKTEAAVGDWIDFTTVDPGNRRAPLTANQYEDARGALDILSAELTLTEVVRAHMQFLRSHAQTVTLGEAVKEFVREKEAAGLRPRSIDSIRLILGRLATVLGENPVVEITSEQLVRFLNDAGLQGTTLNNYRRGLRNLFGWCVRAGYIIENPVDGVTLPRVETSVSGVLTVREAERLLEAASSHQPALVPHLSIGLFAGIRQAEIRCLDWSDITTEHIHINSMDGKGREQRRMEICPSLKLWLAPYQKAFGPITPQSFNKRFLKLRRTAEIQVWPRDGLRGSFGCYHLALHQNPTMTAHEMGHGSPHMLSLLYRNLVTQCEAKRYFGLIPKRGALELARTLSE